MTGRRILKFTLGPRRVVVHTADHPRFIAAGRQGDEIVVWAEATVGEVIATVLVGVFTGDAAPDPANFIGTVQMPDGIVVHVYELVR